MGALAVCLLLAAPAAAAPEGVTLVFPSGGQIRGVLLSDDGRELSLEVDGGTVEFARDAVAEVRREPNVHAEFKGREARTDPKDAGALSGGVMKDPKAMMSRFNAARAELAKHASVNPQMIGAVGYCFGGAVVLNMARAGADLVAVAGFHASLGLNTPAPAPGTVKAKILILNGADDPFVKREQYDTLKKDLDAAKADYRIVEYPGAVHAFTNPEATALGQKFNLPLKYDAKVDGEAKAEAAKLFAAALKK